MKLLILIFCINILWADTTVKEYKVYKLETPDLSVKAQNEVKELVRRGLSLNKPTLHPSD